MITKERLISVLREQLPEFPLNDDWIPDVLGYPIINDVARFICDRAQGKCIDELTRAVSLLDMLWREGDPYIKGLVHECLDTLLSCNELALVEQHLSSELRTISSKMKTNQKGTMS
jgi:hypothetical protein